MENQQPLFPNLKEDSNIKQISEQEAKLETALILEGLLAQGYVNVHEEDISHVHLENLIAKLREE